jgi:hypothetical protein
MFRPVFIALLIAALLVLCASWTGSISTKLLLDHSTYDRLNPLPSAVDTNFLTGLSKASVHTLSNEIDVIDLSASVDLESVSKRHVFVRTRCYPQLLGVIRESQRTVLIGSPGTSKSFLHYYYLARLCNPSLLGPLPPDWQMRTALPSIVIRQTGQESMTIYDLDGKTADKIKGVDARLFECFSPDSTIYLHEPRTSLAEPLFYGHDVPLLSTVSPDVARYKELVKSGADQVYMPTYKLSELLTIGRFLVEQGAVPRDVSYSAASIKERFTRYGGIFRHVLPIGMSAIRSAARGQNKALQAADAGLLLASSDIEQPDISHFLLQYVVEQAGKDKFRTYEIDVANGYVRARLQAKFNARSLDERQMALIRNDETGFMENECEKLYESVLADSLVASGGVNWKTRPGVLLPTDDSAQRTNATNATSTAVEVDWQPLTLALKRVDRTEMPTFADMEAGVVYHPTEKNYPAAGFMFKTGDGRLVCVQVTRQLTSDIKEVKAAMVLELLKRVGLSAADTDKLDFVLVPRPKMQDKARLVLVDSTRDQDEPTTCVQRNGGEPGNDSSALGKAKKGVKKPVMKKKKKLLVVAAELGLRNYTVWGVPPNYGLRYVGLKWPSS